MHAPTGMLPSSMARTLQQDQTQADTAQADPAQADTAQADTAQVNQAQATQAQADKEQGQEGGGEGEGTAGVFSVNTPSGCAPSGGPKQGRCTADWSDGKTACTCFKPNGKSGCFQCKAITGSASWSPRILPGRQLHDLHFAVWLAVHAAVLKRLLVDLACETAGSVQYAVLSDISQALLWQALFCAAAAVWQVLFVASPLWHICGFCGTFVASTFL